MQDLFFEEFDYYPIKREQATQPSVNLSDADLSWITYYIHLNKVIIIGKQSETFLYNRYYKLVQIWYKIFFKNYN